MFVAFYDDGGHELFDHVEGRLPECCDCKSECVALDSKEDAERIAELRARRAAPGANLIQAEVEFLKCYAAVVKGENVAVCAQTKLTQGGVIRFSRAASHFYVRLPPELRDGQRLAEGEQ